MATFKSSVGNRYTLRLEVSESTYSTENNTSNVSWNLYLDSEVYYFQTNNNKASVTINGSSVYSNSSLSINMSGPQTVKIASGTKDGIKHNDNGEKTISVSASFTPSSSASYMPPSLSLSGSLKLTDIARASTVSCSSPYIGDNAVITIGKKASSFTSTVTYKIGSITGTLATRTSETVLQLETSSLKDRIYALIPSGKSTTGTITCTTYSGTTQVGDPATASFTLYAKEDECKPDVSGTVIDTNQKTITLTGDSSKLIRYVSKPKVTVSATSKYSSSISSYSINLDGQTVNQKEYTFDKINSNTININATDTRKYSNPKVLNPSMINYIELHMNAIDLSRPEGTSNEIILNLDGSWFNDKFSNSTSNTLSMSYQYRETGETAWEYGGALQPTISGNTFSIRNLSLGNNYDYSKEYQFKIIATDLLMTVGSDNKEIQTVPKGQEVIAIGEDTVWIYGDMFIVNSEGIYGQHFFRDINVDDGYSQNELVPKSYVDDKFEKSENQLMLTNPDSKHYIEDGTNLNSLTTPGTYKSISTAVTSTLSNVPSELTGGFIMYVINYTSNDTNNNYRQQEIRNGANIWIRYTSNGGSSWSNWKNIA